MASHSGLGNWPSMRLWASARRKASRRRCISALVILIYGFSSTARSLTKEPAAVLYLLRDIFGCFRRGRMNGRLQILSFLGCSCRRTEREGSSQIFVLEGRGHVFDFDRTGMRRRRRVLEGWVRRLESRLAGKNARPTKARRSLCEGSAANQLGTHIGSWSGYVLHCLHALCDI
jgi:hypothetical protein